MQKYHESVLNMTGTPAVGVSVLVSLLNGSVATIYSDNGVTETSNPLTTNSLGYFEFYAADGRYTLTISGSGIETINITDVLLEDPQDGSAMVIDGGTISDSVISGGTVTDSALSNITIDGVAVAGSDIAKYSRLSDADGADLIGFNYAVSYAAGTIGKWLKDLATSVGSTLVGFIQSGTGATLRTVQDKLRETVSVKDFGAVGDGIADDTAEINAAWAAAGTRNLFLPAGTYRVTDTLTGPLTMIIGEGEGRTIIDFDGFSGKDGIVFTAPTTYDRQGGVCGITIRAKNQSGRYAIVTPRAADLNNWRPKYKFDSLAFSGTANTTGFAQDYGWTWMIDHGDCWGSQVSNIDACGTYLIATDPTTQAEQGFMRLAGLQGLLSVRVENITAHNCKNGVEIGDRVFWYFNNVDIAESYKGIYSNRNDATTIYGEGVLHGVIINAQLRGVDLEDRIATMSNHLTINRANGGYDHGAEWIGLRLEDANLCNFNNVKIYAGFKSGGGRFTGNQVGIDVVGGKTLTFTNYIPQALDRCFRTSTSSETSAIPSGIVIAGVASETNVAGSVLFDFQTGRRIQVDGVTWEPSTAPAIVAQFGDTTTARNVQLTDCGPIGASATVGTTGRPEYITDFGAAANEKLWVWVNDNGDLRLQSRSDDEGTAVNAVLINRTGTVIDQTELRGTALKCNNTQTGFYGATPVAKPSITGSRGGNAALASLLTQLATQGLITDNTTA